MNDVIFRGVPDDEDPQDGVPLEGGRKSDDTRKSPATPIGRVLGIAFGSFATSLALIVGVIFAIAIATNSVGNAVENIRSGTPVGCLVEEVRLDPFQGGYVIDIELGQAVDAEIVVFLDDGTEVHAMDADLPDDGVSALFASTPDQLLRADERGALIRRVVSSNLVGEEPEFRQVCRAAIF